jgi:hypothetical protein
MEQYNEPKSNTMVHEEDVRLRSKEIVERPAMRDNLPEGYFPHTDEEKHLSRALNRKLDFVLLPSLSLLYLFNGLDRGNIGNATTQGWIYISIYITEAG